MWLRSRVLDGRRVVLFGGVPDSRLARSQSEGVTARAITGAGGPALVPVLSKGFQDAKKTETGDY
jgi:hypothetical protein